MRKLSISMWCGSGDTPEKTTQKLNSKKHLREGEDWHSCDRRIAAGNGSTIVKDIQLTLNAAKQFLLQAPNGKGDLIRQHFIDSEQKWRLLKTNVDNGRIRLEDKVTGEVVDNPLQDAEYVDTRLETATDHVTRCVTLQRKFGAQPALQMEISSLTSQSVLGKRPRQFLRDNNLLKKRKNRKGRMTYPQHPNGREVMTKDQLHGVKTLQAVTNKLIEKCNTLETFTAKFHEKQKLAEELCKDLHGDHLETPVLLEDVKSAAVVLI